MTCCLRFAVVRDADQDPLVLFFMCYWWPFVQIGEGVNFWPGSLRWRAVSSDDLFLASDYRVAPLNVREPSHPLSFSYWRKYTVDCDLFLPTSRHPCSDTAYSVDRNQCPAFSDLCCIACTGQYQKLE